MDRLIIGENLSGENGIWLSVPGVDVKFASGPGQFLISPAFKNEQVLMTGTIAMPAFTSAPVFFPETLPSAPMVTFQYGQDAGVIQLPWKRSVLTNTARVAATVTPDFVVFLNDASIFQWVYFIVLMRGLGG